MLTNRHKYDVNIVLKDCYHSHNPDERGFRFDPMTKKEIKEYLEQVEQEIKPYTSMPEESCLYRFGIEFNEMQNAKIYLTNPFSGAQKNVSQKFFGYLNIEFNRKNCAKCKEQDCLKNITTGKCQDNLVRKLIGEKLFKDKYTAQK